MLKPFSIAILALALVVSPAVSKDGDNGGGKGGDSGGGKGGDGGGGGTAPGGSSSGGSTGGTGGGSSGGSSGGSTAEVQHPEAVLAAAEEAPARAGSDPEAAIQVAVSTREAAQVRALAARV